MPRGKVTTVNYFTNLTKNHTWAIIVTLSHNRVTVLGYMLSNCQTHRLSRAVND